MPTPRQRSGLILRSSSRLAPFSVVGTAHAETTVATTLSPSVPFGGVDDLLLADVAHVSTSVLTPPAGWNLDESHTATLSYLRYSRVADGSEGATVAWTVNVAVPFQVQIMRLRGLDTLDVDGHSVDDSAASTTAIAPSVTTTGPDRLLICGFVGNGSRAIVTPVSMTLIDQQTANPGAVCAYEFIPIAGATGTRTATYTGGARNRAISSAYRRKAA